MVLVRVAVVDVRCCVRVEDGGGASKLRRLRAHAMGGQHRRATIAGCGRRYGSCVCYRPVGAAVQESCWYTLMTTELSRALRLHTSFGRRVVGAGWAASSAYKYNTHLSEPVTRQEMAVRVWSAGVLISEIARCLGRMCSVGLRRSEC